MGGNRIPSVERQSAPIREMKRSNIGMTRAAQTGTEHNINKCKC